MRNDIRKEFSDGMEALKKEIIGLRSRVEAFVGRNHKTEGRERQAEERECRAEGRERKPEE